jgi:hypothetical protein
MKMVEKGITDKQRTQSYSIRLDEDKCCIKSVLPLFANETIKQQILQKASCSFSVFLNIGYSFINLSLNLHFRRDIFDDHNSQTVRYVSEKLTD